LEPHDAVSKIRAGAVIKRESIGQILPRGRKDGTNPFGVFQQTALDVHRSTGRTARSAQKGERPLPLGKRQKGWDYKIEMHERIQQPKVHTHCRRTRKRAGEPF